MEKRTNTLITIIVVANSEDRTLLSNWRTRSSNVRHCTRGSVSSRSHRSVVALHNHSCLLDFLSQFRRLEH